MTFQWNTLWQVSRKFRAKTKLNSLWFHTKQKYRILLVSHIILQTLSKMAVCFRVEERAGATASPQIRHWTSEERELSVLSSHCDFLSSTTCQKLKTSVRFCLIATAWRSCETHNFWGNDVSSVRMNILIFSDRNIIPKWRRRQRWLPVGLQQPEIQLF